MKNRNIFGSARSRPTAHRGVVLLFSLIVLVILLIAAAAMARSFQTSLFTAGNLGFKRDIRNQSELVVTAVKAMFATGGPLSTSAARASSNAQYNYSATILPTDAQGIPSALQPSNYGACCSGSVQGYNNVTALYVVDRLCSVAGNESSLGSTSCVLANNPVAPGGGALTLINASRATSGGIGAVPQSVVFRLSILVTGPRNTQSFFQSTFSVPS